MDDEDTSIDSQPLELPGQESPQDTSNWEDRAVDAPDGRPHIFTEDYDGMEEL